MEKLTCKNCGSDIYPEDGAKTVICDLCGMEQTVPKVNDLNKLELLVKANDHRRSCRFDVAKKQYENIIEQYPDENEAYWCKLLCEYGIEYVEDFATERNIPTCHRTVKQSIFDHKDYKLIMSRATAEEKAIYEREATEIDRIQKEIMEKAKKEEPYDIFICYKDSAVVNDRMVRTVDSQYANKIYTHLEKSGYKIFFSRITLKNKGGAEYEPLIYGALSTAKVMLFVCANKDYINAPWVRNEWSRYLEFMREDYTKVLVPCLKDVYPYDLPDELAKIQVMDMNEIDFYENLSRQIDSKFGRMPQFEPQPQHEPQPQPQATAQSLQIDNMLKRANMSIEEHDWNKVNEIAEAILNINYECADAYILKLMYDFKVDVLHKLVYIQGFADNANYRKAVRFSSGEQKRKLENLVKEYWYNKATNRKFNLLENADFNNVKNYLTQASGYMDADELLANLTKQREEQEKEKYYNIALPLLSSDLTDDANYSKAKDYFSRAKDYKDVKQLLEELAKKREMQEKKKSYELSLPLLKSDLTNTGNYNKAKDYLTKADDYKDATELLVKLDQKREQQEADRKNSIYARAKEKAKGDNISNYENAIELYKTIIDWKDSSEQIEYCNKRIAEINAQIEAERLAAEHERKRCEELVKSLDSAKSKGEIGYIIEKNQKLLTEITAKYNDLCVLLDKFPEIKSQVDNIDSEIKELERKISALAVEKARLGFFAMKRKKEIDAETKALESQKQDLKIQSELKTKEFNGYTSISTIERDVEKYGKQVEELKERVEESKALLVKEEIIAKLKQSTLGAKLYEEWEKEQKIQKLVTMFKVDRTTAETGTLKVGSIVKFGKYYQSNDTTKEDIEWQVLAKEGNKALLISKYALDCKPYHTELEAVTWETCTLRKWLNNEFANSAFSDAEKEIIPTVTVSADKNPKYSTNPGNATHDKVFLLSIPEANKYFSNSTARQCKQTVYTTKRGADIDDANGNCWWRLRSPGINQAYASTVKNDGGVYDFICVDGAYSAVRPALWVEIES